MKSKSYKGRQSWKAKARDGTKSLSLWTFLSLRVKTPQPVGKITEKAVCGSVFFDIWHCILSAEVTRNTLLPTIFLAILPTGHEDIRIRNKIYMKNIIKEILTTTAIFSDTHTEQTGSLVGYII